MPGATAMAARAHCGHGVHGLRVQVKIAARRLTLQMPAALARLYPGKKPAFDQRHPSGAARWEEQSLDERLLGQRAEGAFLELVDPVEQGLQLLRQGWARFHVLGTNEAIGQILFGRILRRLRRPPHVETRRGLL